MASFLHLIEDFDSIEGHAAQMFKDKNNAFEYWVQITCMVKYQCLYIAKLFHWNIWTSIRM